MAVPPAVSCSPVADLVDWALARLLARVTTTTAVRRHACRPTGVESPGEGRLPGPLVIVAPDGRPASAVIDDFLGRRRIVSRSLADQAVVCRGRDLAAALVREAAGEQPSRLARIMTRQAVVIIDDGEPLGADEPQPGFLSLLDAWTAAGTSVCVSLADHPANLPGFAPAVATRLAAGLVVRLPALPAPAARAAFLASTVTLGRVLRLVADRHDLDVATLVGPRRSRSIVHARSLAMYLARLVTGKSLQAIGRDCGGRDHTTVLHATRMVAARMTADPAFAADVGALVETLSAGRLRGDRHRRDARRDAPPARIPQCFGTLPASGSPASHRGAGRQRSVRRRLA